MRHRLDGLNRIMGSEWLPCETNSECELANMWALVAQTRRSVRL